ncbi:MAG: ribosome maturation factor RimM [Myxococcota bacterium]|nr:ribosome maturation factor RimM [Myxococcota bacterium]
MPSEFLKRFSDTPKEMVCLGYISGVFGVKGEVRVFLHNPESSFLFKKRKVFLRANAESLYEDQIRVRSGAGKKIIGQLDSCRSREHAERLKGTKIFFPKAHLPSLPDGEWYIHQLLGMKVHTESGEYLGDIVEIIQNESEVWVVENKEEIYYIPNTEEDILFVSLEHGVVVPDE